MNTNDEPYIYIVDDDDAVRDAMQILLRSVGLANEAFASAAEFLAGYDPSRHCCLVSDIRMPGMSGIELQQQLNERNIEIPVILITGHGDIEMAVSAMRAGAEDFIEKPFRDQDLIDRIQQALEHDRERRARQGEIDAIRSRMQKLTPRETEVMERVVQGHANKVIAMDLGVSQRTVELHRARVMQKLRVRSLADLVRASSKVAPP